MIKIYTYSFNNPKYLDYQIKSFRKFMKEPFEFICIDNSIDPMIRNTLIDVCNKYGVAHHINMKPDHSLAGLSHASALQWSFNTFMANDNDNINVMIDHDTFPIIPISIFDLLGDSAIAGAPQSVGHIHYLHPSLIIMDMQKLPNKHTMKFCGANIDGINVDIGGQLYLYFRDNPSVNIKHLRSYLISDQNKNMQWIPQQFHNDYDRTYLFEIKEDKLIHTRLGSNWIHIKEPEFRKRDEVIYGTLDYYLNGQTDGHS